MAATHRWRWALLVAAACATGCTGSSRPASASNSDRTVVPAAFAGIPNVIIDYYEVSGGTAAEIRRSVDAGRPYDENFGRRADALTSWGIDWSIPVVDGRCDPERAEVRYRARVKLPRLRDDAALAEPDRGKWLAFRTWLEEHEAWHARHAWDRVKDVRAAIRSSGCGTAEAAAGAVVRAIAKAQYDYDVATRHGANGGVSFP